MLNRIRDYFSTSTHAKTEKTLSTDALGKEQATPSLHGVRKSVNDHSTAGYTPAQLAQVLTAAADMSNTADYFKLAESIEEKDLQFRSLLSTRKLAVQGLNLLVEAQSDDARDVEIADAVRSLLASDPVQEAIPDLLNGLRDGWSVCEAIYVTGAARWTIGSLIHRPAYFFELDKLDHRTLRLRSDTPGGAPTDLLSGKYAIHMPKLKTGSPIRSGLAYVAAWAWLIKSIALKDWLVFAEVFGQPLRLGKYNPGAPEKDIAVLRKAVASLGTDAAAVLPNNMVIEFIDAARNGGGGEVYQKLCDYLDAQLAKLILGGTLTSGTGSGTNTNALGRVHDEVRSDILRADAKALARTIRRDIVEPFVRLNFGDNVEMPLVRFDIEEAEDLQQFMTAVEKAVDLGVEIEQSVIRDKLGLEEPAAGAKLLERKSAPIAPIVDAQQSRGCPVHDISTHAAGEAACDAMDDLADELHSDFERVSEPVRDFLLESVANATSLEEMRVALENAIMSAPADELIEALTAARAKTRIAGESGADL